MNETQINTFIVKNDIKQEMVKLFSSLLKNNSTKGLGVTDKNLSIDTDNIATNLIDNIWILFKAPIQQIDVEIGNYSLKYSLTGELIDDYFTIYQ